MHGGGKRNYECHMIIHNGQFAECEVLENFQELCGPRVQGQGLVNWSLRTRTFLDDYNTGTIKSNYYPC